MADKIFVAHNVNFDYSFIKRAFEQAGYLFTNKKLCTVRLSRQIIPNQRSYSLGNLCESLGIDIQNRHRAMGDAAATSILFKKLLDDNPDAVRAALKSNSKEMILPPHLPKEEYLALPESPGVYYFLNERAEVIYVGKAINIKKRITSHFGGSSKNTRNQRIRNEVHHIDYELTGNELVALVLESQEIKRLWPIYNRSQKYVPNQWGIYKYEDRSGYPRLQVSKRIKGAPPLISFNNHADGFHFMLNKIKEFDLCPKLSGIQKTDGACYDVALGYCKGACSGKEPVVEYTERVDQAIESFTSNERSFAIIGEGRRDNEWSIILIEKGQYLGFGFTQQNLQVTNLEEAKLLIDLYKPTSEIENYIASYANSMEAEILEFS